MKLFNEAEKKAEKILGEIESHPLTVKIRADQAVGVLATRTEAAAKIEILNEERDRILPKLQADFEKKEEKFKKAKAALDHTVDEANTAKAALSNKRHFLEAAINQQESILYETAAPEIDKARAFFNKKLDFLRSVGRINQITAGSVTNFFSMGKTAKWVSNKDAVLSALTYCQTALKKLEKMRLSPVLDMEKIEKIKKEIPSIEVLTEFTGEKSLTRQGVDPRALLPSDSAMKWKRDRLIEKAEKILKR